MNLLLSAPATELLPTKLSDLIRKQLLNETGHTGERRRIREQVITPYTTFTLCIDDSSWIASADTDNPGANTAFTRGKCAYLAYRLHKLTGLPFAVWTDPTTERWTGHVAIALPNGNFLDFDGVVSNGDIQRRYGHTLTEQPTIHETIDEVNAILTGDLSRRYKGLDPLPRELINYFCDHLIEDI